MVDLFLERPVLLLFSVMALGTALGAIRLRRLSLGPAAVLFTALAFSAYDERLALPEVLGTFGLAVFAYAIGLTAGPSFFSSLRRGARPVGLVVVTLVALGALTVLAGRLLGFSTETIAGLYAGSTTNTPALAAALVSFGGAPGATVAYSLAYVGGVLVMLLAAQWALRPGAAAEELAEDDDTPPPVRNVTIQVTRDNALQVRELTHTPHGRVMFSRAKSPEGDIELTEGSMIPRPGDLVLAVGPEEALQHVTKQLGRRTHESLDLDRSDIDFRRITLSNSQFYGRTVGELALWERVGARPTRVRRGDEDFLATDDFVLQAGDRIRVAAPRDHMTEVARLLGDSDHGFSDINPLGLALGLALGLLLGAVPFHITGIGTLELGQAAGPLIAGLVLGRIGRSGPVVWSLPHQAAETLTQLGLLLFLAYAGGRAGSAFVDAIASPLGWKVIGAGLVLTTVHAVVLVVLGRRIAQLVGPRLAGTIAGSQTQPAVLAFAKESTAYDPRVSLGYALVYPAAMVAKILVVQVLAIL